MTITVSTRIVTAMAVTLLGSTFAVQAQDQAKPNILFIVSDDTGYGDLGPYGGGEGRGMPTPSIDRLAEEGMTFFSFYAQPSCTPGRAAMQTGRIPNRSGMTTVAFQGQGGGSARRGMDPCLGPEAGWVQDLLHRQWHLAKPTMRCRTPSGYDVMKYARLYHLNAYTYADPTWFPDMDPTLREMFQKVTQWRALRQRRGDLGHGYDLRSHQ